jgi:hypothetical protein
MDPIVNKASLKETFFQDRRKFFRASAAMLLMASVVLLTQWDSPLQASVRPAVSLEQCSNLTSTCDTTHAANWQTGNLGISNSDYAEGDSIPYRSIASNLTVGQTYELEIEWDTSQSGKHAIDYLTSYNRTESTANPCSGMTCSGGISTLPIPIDPHVGGAGVSQVSGQTFTAFGATFPASGATVNNTGGNLCGSPTCSIPANPTAYSLNGTFTGTSETGFSIYFTATHSTAVIAWGGHIARRLDWGAGHSAADVSGSPYHMRVIDFQCSNVDNCSSGNMDRSLSADAVSLPASITIVKQATNESSTAFSFIGTPSPLTNFNLIDDGTAANTKVFSGITTFGTYVLTESSMAGWGLDRVSCSIANQVTGTATVRGSVATIALAEGEDVICTFFNAPLPAPELDLSKTADAESFSAVGDLITYTYALTNTGNTILGPSQFFIDDDKINGGNPFECGAAATTLLIGKTVTCTAGYTVVPGDLESGSITNIAFGVVRIDNKDDSPCHGESVRAVDTDHNDDDCCDDDDSDHDKVAANHDKDDSDSDCDDSSKVLTSPTRQVTVTYIPPATTTTIPIATTTIPIATTTIPVATTTIPIATTTIPIATTTIPEVATTTIPIATTTIPIATTTIPEIATTTIPAVTTTLVISGTTIPEVATTTIPAATTTLPAATTTTVVAPTTTAPSEFQVVTPDDPTGTEDVLDVLFPDALPNTGWPVGGITLIAGLVLLLGVGVMTMSSQRRQRRNGGR